MDVGAFTATALRADAAVVCLSLAGDLDLSAVTTLQEALDRAEALAPADLLLDLSDLSFLDSTGLHCIVRAHERAQHTGRRLVVVPGVSPVHRVMELTGVDKHLEFVTRADLEALLSAGSTMTVLDIPPGNRRSETPARAFSSSSGRPAGAGDDSPPASSLTVA